MQVKPNPIHRSGFRNIQCPHYHSCLDHAAKNFWRCWDCNDCHYKLMVEALEALTYAEDCADITYAIPGNIYQEVA